MPTEVAPAAPSEVAAELDSPNEGINLADFGLTPEGEQIQPTEPTGKSARQEGDEPQTPANPSVNKGVNQPVNTDPKTVNTPAAPAAPANPRGQGRDYAGITDARTKDLLAKMSNDAFAHFAPIARRLAAGELMDKAQAETTYGKPPPSFIDHAEGYKLTEDYAHASQAFERNEQIRQHWVEQLANIEDKKPVYNIRIDSKGNLVKSEQAYNPNAHARAYVQDMLLRCNGTREEITRDVRELVAKHKEAQTSYTKAITDYDKTVFGEMAGNKDFQAKVAKHLAQFPAHIRAKPEATVVAKYHVMHDILLPRLQAAEAELARLKSSSGAAHRGGSPDPSTIPATGASGGSEAEANRAAMEEFERMMESTRR